MIKTILNINLLTSDHALPHIITLRIVNVMWDNQSAGVVLCCHPGGPYPCPKLVVMRDCGLYPWLTILTLTWEIMRDCGLHPWLTILTLTLEKDLYYGEMRTLYRKPAIQNSSASSYFDDDVFEDAACPKQVVPLQTVEVLCVVSNCPHRGLNQGLEFVMNLIIHSWKIVKNQREIWQN